MSHNHNLSINSVNSLIEPTTPPNLVQRHTRSTSVLSGSGGSGAVGSSVATPFHHTKSGSLSGSNLLFAGPQNFNSNIHVNANAASSSAGVNGGVNGGANSSANPHASANSRGQNKIDKDYIASISKVPLVQLKSDILRLSKDQYGCRFLQKKIDENLIPNYQTRLNNFEVIFAQIHPYLYELIIDPFGNYLIQKLIVYCNESNLNLILQILQYNLFQISINQHGTRALQKIIDNLNNQYQLNLLIKGMKPYIIELIKDLNGNHVIQKILNKYPPSDCQFIYDSIIEGLYVVASHKHGCCVLQKCLNHVTMTQLQEFSACILDFANFQLLINDQFGNYVLQYLISINSFEINYKIFQNFLQFGINNLCNLKFSSNVVEKFLKNCYNNEAYNGVTAVNFSNLKMELIYNILINDLNKLINDPYGNYVIQTLIDILINQQVPSGKIEKLSLLLPAQEPIEDDSQLQVVIIKYWFSNCKIVSSFGKRIQSKINSIVNDRNHVHSVGTNSSNKPFQHNMNQNSYRRNLSISSD
ncbi:protein necessary for high temperature growth, partial [Scheffersomyces stipitis CBS 6054]